MSRGQAERNFASDIQFFIPFHSYKDRQHNSCSFSQHKVKDNVTELDEIFSGYQPPQMSVWNRRFEDHLGHHHHHHHHHHIPDDDRNGPQNVGSIQTSEGADSPRGLNRM
jgi:hypothetical protein